MIDFQSGQPISAESINSNFREAAGGGLIGGNGQFGVQSSAGFTPRRESPELPEGCIYVRLDYPARAPAGAIVGIDGPIKAHAVSDAAGMRRFMNQETIYSCTKNQYRTHNRFGELLQPLLPGQVGIARISGVAKTFWHAQMGPTYDAIYWEYPQRPADMLPYETTDGPRDSYKSLGILAANFGTDYGTIYELSPLREYGLDGSEHYYETVEGKIVWNNRTRPWWLAPTGAAKEFPRRSDSLSYPYAELQEINPETPEVLGEQTLASGRGRAMAVSGFKVPAIECEGSSTVTCNGGKWYVTASTCSEACSSWPAIENPTVAESLGISWGCTNGETVSNVPCFSEYPVEDVDDGSRVAEGAWSTIDNACNTWLAGTVVFGAPFELPSEDTQAEYGYDYEVRKRVYGVNQIEDVTTDNPNSAIFDYETVLRRCANITCSYECDGTSWVRWRGQTPWILDDYWSCKCPDEWMETMSSADLPCNSTSQPREFTVGMVLGAVNTTTTTTTTTTSTTTTTTGTGACCVFAAFDGAYQSCTITNMSDCIASPGSGGLGGVYQGNGSVCDGSCYGACCRDSGCVNTTEGICNFIPGTYPWMGYGTDCSSDPCSTTTTSTTTTTTAGSSTTTSTTTTTTAQPTGACCLSDHCEIATVAGCGMTLGGYYQGDGTVCEPDPCTYTTTSTTTTTTAGSSSTTTSTTTTTTSGSECGTCTWKCESQIEGGYGWNNIAYGCTGACSCSAPVTSCGAGNVGDEVTNDCYTA